MSHRTTSARALRHGDFRLRPFRPARWLPGAHLQTVLGKFLRPTPDPGLDRIRVNTPDGDFLDLDLGPDPSPEAPIALILHGLEGSTRRAYVRVAMAELTRRGVRPVGLNFRSCSGVPNLRPRFYHSGDIEDLSLVLDLLRKRFPDRPLGVLGFSLGGNVLLRYLGLSGAEAADKVRGAAVISVPFDLTEGTHLLERSPMGRIYTYYFLRSLRAKTRAKLDLLAPLVDVERVLAARTLREFDDAATAPLHGFADAWEYYREASSAPLLTRVAVPTLLLHASDDPFLPPSSIPHTAVAANPWLFAGFSDQGGHVGFVEGRSPRTPSFWAEREAARYLAEVFGLEARSKG